MIQVWPNEMKNIIEERQYNIYIYIYIFIYSLIWLATKRERKVNHKYNSTAMFPQPQNLIPF